MLIHGTSPRYYETDEGGNESFCLHGKDNSELFRKHQKLFLQSLGLKNKVLFHTRQVHGNQVSVLNDPKISTNDLGQQEADAIVTHLPDFPIMVLTADCVPIIIYDPMNHVIGVVHAGRKGTQKYIFTNTNKFVEKEIIFSYIHKIIAPFFITTFEPRL